MAKQKLKCGANLKQATCLRTVKGRLQMAPHGSASQEKSLMTMATGAGVKLSQLPCVLASALALMSGCARMARSLRVVR